MDSRIREALEYVFGYNAKGEAVPDMRPIMNALALLTAEPEPSKTCETCANHKVGINKCERCRNFSNWKEQGYWWCPECKEEIIPQRVTFQECHDTCGTRVIWKEPVTAEPEPCEDAEEVASRIRGSNHDSAECDMIPFDEAVLVLKAYATQVSDKRAEELREPMRWFAGEMEKKLKENDWKEQWPKLPNKQLVDQLDAQGPLLVAAIISGDAYEIIRRAVNLANYSMMLADKARSLLAATEAKPEGEVVEDGGD